MVLDSRAHPGPDVRVLGPLEVVADSVPVPVPAGAQRGLLALLLLGRGHPVTVSRLLDGLWGEEQPQDPRAALHTAVARLRRTLEGTGCSVRTVPPGYALEVPPESVDADRFLELHARARSLLTALNGEPVAPADASEAAVLLRSALELWRGPAWGEFADGVASGEALRLEEALLAAREDLATAALHAGDPAESVALLESVVAEHPLRDRTVGLLMDALHRYGRTADALSVYGGYRERLADELGLDPSPTLAALHQRVLRQEVPAVAPRTAERLSRVRPSHAPRSGGVAGTRLVGREQDAAAVRELLSAAPLVTLVGPGGVGKTRLAQHVADQSGSTAHWVDLVPVRDRRGVVQALADALGLEARPGRSVEAAVQDRLADEPALVVLDNCEHVLNDVADVLDEAGRSGPLLATSRERLGVPGERVFPVDPLGLPAPETSDANAPAVELFLERARDAGVELGDDEDVIRRVGDVCRALDGLPLALELGAARIGTVTLDDLAERLDRRFDLLTRGPRTAPRRHRTLRSVVDWSYELLDEDEKVVFARLAVFPSGFDLTAAEAVVAGPAVPEERLADVVAALADRSMVVRPTGAGRGKYRLLESLRQYALSRLGPEELAAVRRRHASWAVSLAEEARRGVEGPDERRWARALESVLDDLRAAWRWSQDAQDPQTADRLVAATWRWGHWRQRNDLLRWGSDLLATRGEDAPGVAYAAAAGGAWLEGELDQAVDVAALGRRRHVDDVSQAYLDEVMGDVHLSRSEVERAVERYGRAAEVNAAHGDRLNEALALGNQALALTYARRPAAEAAERALVLSLETRNPTAIAFARYAEGEAWAEEDPARAATALEEAVDLADDVGNRLVSGVAMTALVALRGRAEEVGPATFELYRRVVRHWSAATRNPTLLVTALRNLVILLAHAGREEDAVELWAAVQGVDAGHPSYGVEAERLAAVVAAAQTRLGTSFDEAVLRGRSHRGLAAVSDLADRLCAEGPIRSGADGARATRTDGARAASPRQPHPERPHSEQPHQGGVTRPAGGS